ncbi:hypothetical protein NE236_25405 [Actinoallomurus purpureus]|uniref:hypothetical protein n=1 Tax=Actinoallomurus purpureus TaxID=478114 RepID=UPI002092C2E3|nr:hypothetical protein [Actinoallomurus purpureus]MCO6008319.1 hypothetical protein [Actinoallomurus purpureus]
MKTKRLLRVPPAAIRRLSGPLFSDPEDLKILAIAALGGLVAIAKNYFLAATGVITNMGPFMTAIIIMVISFSIQFRLYRPSLRCSWPVWRSVLVRGIILGANNVAALYTFRWIAPQTLAPLGFFCTAVFTLGGDVLKDARKGRYSTAVWPILAVPGIVALMNDPARRNGAHFSPGPGLPILGHEVPGWILGVGAVIITSATYAVGNRQMEALDRDLKGKISTLAAIPALAILAVGASSMDGGWKVLTSNWSDLLLCAGAGVVATLSSVLVIKAYEGNLRASANAMLSPLMTLASILMGMLVEMTVPGPLGWLGIILIVVASYGAAKYQSRRNSDSD